jgi:hypothetical protein
MTLPVEAAIAGLAAARTDDDMVIREATLLRHARNAGNLLGARGAAWAVPSS